VPIEEEEELEEKELEKEEVTVLVTLGLRQLIV